MAEHSPSAVTRILEGVFTPSHENSQPEISNHSLPPAPCQGGDK